MSTIEGDRWLIIESGSPLRRHSLNQGVLRLQRQGEDRMEPSRKATKAAERVERRQNTLRELQDGKTLRILERVVAVLVGYSGSDTLVFNAEVRYLHKLGIHFVLEKNNTT